MAELTRELEPVWQPHEDDVADANITGFMRSCGMQALEDLWDWTKRDIAGFYDTLLRFIGVAWQKPYERTLDLSRGKPFARWFTGAAYNASFGCLDRHVAEGRGEELALLWEDESGATRR